MEAVTTTSGKGSAMDVSSNAYTGGREARLLASLDQSKFTRKHWWLYAALTLTHLTDGFDLLMIGVVLPGIAATFKLTPTEAGLLGSSAFVGMALGAVTITYLADQFGRKKALLLCVFLYGVLSLVAAVAWDYYSILITRLIQGVGIGAEMPLVLTYLMEFVPVRRRGVSSAATISLWQFAGLFAALAAIVIVPAFTWRGMFVLGAIPVLVMMIVLFLIPESIRYLVHRNRLEEAEQIVKRFSSVDPATVRVEPKPTPARIELGDILRGKYLRCTLGAWIMSVAWSMAFFGMSVWLPSLLMRSGFTLVHSFAYTAAITAAGAAGVFMSGIFMDWLGRRTAMTLGFFLGGLSMIAWGLSTTPALILTFGLLTAFVGTGGVAGCLFTYICEIYPTEFRATGAGFSIAWQRIGGIIAPTALGLLVGTQSSAFGSFVLLGGLLIVGAIVAIALTYETGGKTLEQITVGLAA
jgi:MFS transporter, putative metabolite:H+ symporter